MQNDVGAPKIISLPIGEFPQRVAEEVEREIRSVLEARGECRLALAGGETPRAVHEALAARGAGIDWQRVWITFGDERSVPPDHADSNYRMARESLLERVPIAPEHVLRIRGELPQVEAAAEYEEQLARAWNGPAGSRYVHDLVMLGMGEDGHTASLFPGSPATAESVRNVIAANGPKPPPQRVSMTLPLLNSARKVFFVVAGAPKAPVLRKIFAGDRSFPAARVRPSEGEVIWLLGSELAALAQSPA